MKPNNPNKPKPKKAIRYSSDESEEEFTDGLSEDELELLKKY
jgi:TolB-like protein